MFQSHVIDNVNTSIITKNKHAERFFFFRWDKNLKGKCRQESSSAKKDERHHSENQVTPAVKALSKAPSGISRWRQDNWDALQSEPFCFALSKNIDWYESVFVFELVFMSSADFHCWRPIVINFQNLLRCSFDKNDDRINGNLKLRGTDGSTNHEPRGVYSSPKLSFL